MDLFFEKLISGLFNLYPNFRNQYSYHKQRE